MSPGGYLAKDAAQYLKEADKDRERSKTECELADGAKAAAALFAGPDSLCSQRHLQSGTLM